MQRLHSTAQLRAVRSVIALVLLVLAVSIVSGSMASGSTGDHQTLGKAQIYGMTAAIGRPDPTGDPRKTDIVLVIARNISPVNRVAFTIYGYNHTQQLGDPVVEHADGIGLVDLSPSRYEVDIQNKGKVSWIFFAFQHVRGTTKYCATGLSKVCSG